MLFRYYHFVINSLEQLLMFFGVASPWQQNILLTYILWRQFTRNLVKDQRYYSLFTGINTIIKWFLFMQWLICRDVYDISTMCYSYCVLPSSKNAHILFCIFVFTLNQCRKSCYFYYFIFFGVYGSSLKSVHYNCCKKFCVGYFYDIWCLMSKFL